MAKRSEVHCNICDHVDKRRHMDRHMEMHERYAKKANKFKCDHCFRSYTTKNNRKKHQKLCKAALQKGSPIVNEEVVDERSNPEAAPNTPKGEMNEKVDELLEQINTSTRQIGDTPWLSQLSNKIVETLPEQQPEQNQRDFKTDG